MASSGHLPGVSSDKSLPCLADNFIFQRAAEVAESGGGGSSSTQNPGSMKTPAGETVVESSEGERDGGDLGRRSLCRRAGPSLSPGVHEKESQAWCHAVVIPGKQ